MNIQNFETAYLNAGGKASELKKEDGEYVSSKAQMGWQMWQAAKAQAVPEGFVLMPKEPTPEIVGAFWNNWLVECPNAQTVYYAYKAMIEAQEPAND